MFKVISDRMAMVSYGKCNYNYNQFLQWKENEMCIDVYHKQSL